MATETQRSRAATRNGRIGFAACYEDGLCPSVSRLYERTDIKGVASRYAAEQALRAAALGRCEIVSALATQSLALQHNAVALPRTALALTLCGQSARAQIVIDELNKQDQNTLVNGLWMPTIRGALELQRGNASRALEELVSTVRYEAAADFWPQYLRGLALLKLEKSSEAATEFQKIIEDRGQAPLSLISSMARLGLARLRLLTKIRRRVARLMKTFSRPGKMPMPICHRCNKPAQNTRS